MHQYDKFVENIKTIVVSESDVLCLQFTDGGLFRAFMSMPKEDRDKFILPIKKALPNTSFFIMGPGIELLAINKEVAEETDGINPTD